MKIFTLDTGRPLRFRWLQSLSSRLSSDFISDRGTTMVPLLELSKGSLCVVILVVAMVSISRINAELRSVPESTRTEPSFLRWHSKLSGNLFCRSSNISRLSMWPVSGIVMNLVHVSFFTPKRSSSF